MEIKEKYRNQFKWFEDSPDSGLSECICSYIPCNKVIPEDEVPIRIFDTKNNKELRFHTECFGIVTEQKIITEHIPTVPE